MAEKYIQVGVTALRNPATGEFLPAVPLYIKAEDSAEAAEEKLIEDIGYRGRTIGGAKVSEKHVNFIVNEDCAKASDYLELVQEIQEKVRSRFGIDLHMEVEKFNWD